MIEGREGGKWIYLVVIPEKQVELFDNKVDKEVFELEVGWLLVFVDDNEVSFRRSVYVHSDEMC